MIYNEIKGKKEYIKKDNIINSKNYKDMDNMYIQHFNENENKLTTFFLIKIDNNKNIFYPYVYTSNIDKNNPKPDDLLSGQTIMIEIQNNLDNYFGIGEIVIIKNKIDYKKINYNDIGRIFDILIDKNNLSYYVKFENGNTFKYPKEALNKTNINEYFINDIVLYYQDDNNNNSLHLFQ